MAVKKQVITDQYALYNGDCVEMIQTIPAESIHMSIYSPPFAVDGAAGTVSGAGGGSCLYNYSSSDRDFSNSRSYAEFFEHYEFLVREIHRIMIPGRISAVHCTDIPCGGANICGYSDFPGDIIRLHQKIGFDYLPRISIWKEPLEVRNRTMAKALAHRQITEDSTKTNVAAGDYLIPFRKRGENPIPVTHENGFLKYCGEREVPRELHRFKNWKGKQTENRFSHWIWRHYASCVWDDIRLSRVLKYKEARDAEDERHQHPLQLDVIERGVEMWTNPGEKVFSPFMGVGSEIAGAVMNGRLGIGVELKPSYYRQAVKNLASINLTSEEQETLFGDDEPHSTEETELEPSEL